MLRIKVDEKALKSVLAEFQELTYNGWIRSKEVNLKSIWLKNGIPPTGIIATNLTSWLIKKEILLERKGGRLGISWRWNEELIDVDSVTTRYTHFLKSLDHNGAVVTQEVQKKFKPSEFHLGDSVYLVHENKIELGKVILLKLDESTGNTIYGVRVGEQEVSICHALLHVTIDDVLMQLKEDVQERLSK